MSDDMAEALRDECRAIGCELTCRKCSTRDAANRITEDAARIAALEAERDQALAERDDNAAALREFIADRDRLEAEVARLRAALGEIRDRSPTQLGL